MWEYASMWHRAQWQHNTNTGWVEWVTKPPTLEAPPADLTDIEALTFMGRQGWELVTTTAAVDANPEYANYQTTRVLYIFKRPTTS